MKKNIAGLTATFYVSLSVKANALTLQKDCGLVDKIWGKLNKPFAEIYAATDFARPFLVVLLVAALFVSQKTQSNLLKWAFRIVAILLLLNVALTPASNSLLGKSCI